MPSYKKSTVFNVIFGLLYQLIMIPTQFLLRYILLKFIGVEFIGISCIVVSLVGVLCLAESGFSTAILYCLYKPIVEKNYARINQILSAYKKLYSYIGIFILFGGGILSSFIDLFFTGIEITSLIYAIFYLETFNAAISYFLCYRRTLLQAYTYTYVCNIVDIACNTIFTIFGIVIVYLTHDYILYLLVIIAKTMISNLVIHVWCGFHFEFLANVKTDKNIFREILGYSKNLIFGNIAGYVYNSTDNLVISTFSSSVSVGYLSNYTMITNYLKNMVGVILLAPNAAFGQKFSKADICTKINLYEKYNQLCCLFAVLLSVPTFSLFDYFIGNVYGKQFVMEIPISILLTIIVYLYVFPFAYGIFINISGSFVLLKRVEIIGAIINLVSSLIFVQFYGVYGVLLGTVFSVIVQWGIRQHFVLKTLLKMEYKDFLVRWIKDLVFILITLLSIVTVNQISKFLSQENFILTFIEICIISFVIPSFFYYVLYQFRDKILFLKMSSSLFNKILHKT